MPRNASPSEIKDSYFKLSRVFHPDNTATGNIKKFIRLREAYEAIQIAPLHPSHDPTDYRDHLSHKAMIEDDQATGQWAENSIEPPHLRLYRDGDRPKIGSTITRIMRGRNSPSIHGFNTMRDDF